MKWFRRQPKMVEIALNTYAPGFGTHGQDWFSHDSALRDYPTHLFVPQADWDRYCDAEVVVSHYRLRWSKAVRELNDVVA